MNGRQDVVIHVCGTILGRLRQADFHESGARLDYTSIPGLPRLQSKILFQKQKQTTTTKS